MKKRIKVSVGVSVYNEENCIKEMILSILNQEQKDFVLDKIIIGSDGSTDGTESLVRSIKDPRIILIADNKRLGKSERMNQIFRSMNSDIAIILDADIKIYSKYVFSNLIKPIVKNGAELTAGKITPMKPSSFVQKAVYTGTKLWDETRNASKNSDMYYCGGAIRAFSKKLYKEIKFPKIKAEDIYPYLYCKTKGYKFSYVETAEIFHTLPSKLNDYVKQMNRYLSSPIEQKTVYDKRIVDNEFSITFKTKLYVLCKEFIKNPFWVSMYVCILTIPKIQVLFGRHINESTYK